MGHFSELDLDKELDFSDLDLTNEAIVPTEELRLQLQAIVSDLSAAEKELLYILERWRYNGEIPERETIERILSYITMARRTLA
jgi:hypothetical protein